VAADHRQASALETIGALATVAVVLGHDDYVDSLAHHWFDGTAAAGRVIAAKFQRRDPSRRIDRPHAPRDLGAVFTLDYSDVVLTLQIKPELCAVSKIAAEPHCRIGSDRPAPVEYVRDAA